MLKRYLLFIPLLFTAFSLKAQIDVNYTQYGIGGGVSYVKGFTNLNTQFSHFAQYANFTYYLTGYIPLSFEVQKGVLSGGGVTIDPYGRAYTDNYLSFGVHGDFQMGQIIDQDDFFSEMAKGFYGGLGAGYIINNDNVQRTNVILANGPLTYVFPGVDNSASIMASLRVGYEFRITNSFGEPFIRIDLGYVQNVVFGQGLDGYSDPANHFKNNAPDQYRQISLGIKFDFGSREK